MSDSEDDVFSIVFTVGQMLGRACDPLKIALQHIHVVLECGEPLANPHDTRIRNRHRKPEPETGKTDTKIEHYLIRY